MRTDGGVTLIHIPMDLVFPRFPKDHAFPTNRKHFDLLMKYKIPPKQNL